MLVLIGGSALSAFRVEALLDKCRKLSPGFENLSARNIYFIDGRVSTDTTDKLQELLAANPIGDIQPDLITVPRAGTISPWASKATDIAHNCGLSEVSRIERGTAWFSEGGITENAHVLFYDRMTEMVLSNTSSAESLFEDKAPAPLLEIDVLDGGVEQLKKDNVTYGFALSDDEIEYLVESFKTINRNPTDAELMMFAQANSEHCRHKIFNADWVVDGEPSDSSLFGMIRETHKAQPSGTLIAYDDNAAVIEGSKGQRFMADPVSGSYRYTEEPIHIQIKVETHNHPTAISPFPGAATGSGGEIRDEGATGNGAKPKAGLCGFSVSNLRIPGFTHQWEQHAGKPEHIASAFQIMQEGPIGAAAFNNEFGRPNLTGYFRAFESEVPVGAVEDSAQSGPHWSGFHKPIMIAGGLGNIRPLNVNKKPVPDGSAIVVLGGPAMLIGLGGGAASSLASGQSDASLDFASVQRGNPEMQRRCQEVINHCVSLGDNSPILSMHDVGAGGLSNALPELVHDADRGATFELREILIDEHGMSPMEIWCNESQERYVLAVAADRLPELTALCDRERCPFAVVGVATNKKHLTVTDRLLNKPPVDMSLQVLLGKPPRMKRETSRNKHCEAPLDLTSVAPEKMSNEKTNNEKTGIEKALRRVLQSPTVASKNFLITIGDRTVGGLVHRDQLVGPYQMPVADCAVTLSDFDGFAGEAMAMGERSPVALISPEASGRIAIAEALTNLAGVAVADIKDIKLSANWMAAANVDDAALYDTVKAVVRDFCLPLGLSIPVGKDSLSMQTRWSENGQDKVVTAPLSLVVTAFSKVADVRKTVTPQLVKTPDTVLLLADIGKSKNRLGASVFAQVHGQIGNECPDVDDVIEFKALISSLQELMRSGLVMACHDRSDGGVIAAIAEMCFAGGCGAEISFSDSGGDNGIAGVLFSEEIGVLLQVRRSDLESVRAVFAKNDILQLISEIGTVTDEPDLIVSVADETVLSKSVVELKRLWWETSYQMQQHRDNPACAEQEFETIADAEDPGITTELTYKPSDNPVDNIVATITTRPKIAILREQGVNGQVEMAAAFDKAGFESIDVHMSDIITGRVTLDEFSGLAACGGFSYGDVLGAGGGWASSILHNERARDQFAQYFARPDVFALGVCNGCQMMSKLRELIPGAAHWPDFVRNVSEQYEARFSTVQVQSTASILFTGMEGSRIPVAVAHGEGKVSNILKTSQVSLRYVDNLGKVTERYPLNPNGSAEGVTGLCNEDGRFNIMMPHPERVFRSVQNSYRSADWPEDGPWLRMFRNARLWVSQV